jgi:hypothetical protein
MLPSVGSSASLAAGRRLDHKPADGRTILLTEKPSVTFSVFFRFATQWDGPARRPESPSHPESNSLEGIRTMRRSFKIVSAASLLAAIALLSNAAPIFAARCKHAPELLADAYQGIYDATCKAGDSAGDPLARSRSAAQLAADAVAGAKGRTTEQPQRSPAAEEAAFKAATAALQAAPPGWQSTHVKFAYKDAYKAACDALRKENPGNPDLATRQAAQKLPLNLQALVLRGAKLRVDQQTAIVATAFAVARAVSQKIEAEKAAGADAAVDRGAVNGSAAEK